MKIPHFIVILLLLLFACNAPVKACDCAFLLLATEIEQTKVIFIGKVVKNDNGIWEIAVSKYWKSPVAKTIKLIDTSWETSCAGEYTKGEAYIFFVSLAEKPTDKTFIRHACTRTTKLGLLMRYGEKPFTTIEVMVQKKLGKGSSPTKE